MFRISIWIALKDALNDLSGVALKYLQPLTPEAHSAYHAKGCFCSCADRVDWKQTFALADTAVRPDRARVLSRTLTRGGEAELKIWIPWVGTNGAARDIQFSFSVFQEDFPHFVIREACLLFWWLFFFQWRSRQRLLSALNLKYCGKLLGKMLELFFFYFFPLALVFFQCGISMGNTLPFFFLSPLPLENSLCVKDLCPLIPLLKITFMYIQVSDNSPVLNILDSLLISVVWNLMMFPKVQWNILNRDSMLFFFPLLLEKWACDKRSWTRSEEIHSVPRSTTDSLHSNGHIITSLISTSNSSCHRVTVVINDTQHFGR